MIETAEPWGPLRELQGVNRCKTLRFPRWHPGPAHSVRTDAAGRRLRQ